MLKLIKSHTKISVKVSRRCMATELTYNKYPFLKELGIKENNYGVFNGEWFGSGDTWTMHNPATGEAIANVTSGTVEDYDACLRRMNDAKTEWALMPAPRRGEVVRKIGNALRDQQDNLGSLIALEMGKIKVEGVGEVQEAVDICDFATGLSRQLNGSVIPSERPGHFMMERYNPLKGHVGIITAFNFPCAVFYWNTALSMICGNTNLWKPADSLALTSIACTKITADVLESESVDPAIASLIVGSGATIGEKLINDPTMELVSFTGSTATGRHVSKTVASRFGKSILELGGNNAMIILEDADLELAVRGTLFSAVGTAGQRCTSLRRVLVHESIFDEFTAKLIPGYKSIQIGDPLDETTLCGPLHNQAAVDNYSRGIKELQEQGGQILVGGNVMSEKPGYFVEPTVAIMPKGAPIMQEEIFGPIMYIVKIKDLNEAIDVNNSVPQGLSSSLFTKNIQNVFQWTGAAGSDCGIVNVNIGPSGAEIGGAFGGEKDTGGGRESGSDAWKQYMRRSTCTINYSDELPLAQGINFGN